MENIFEAYAVFKFCIGITLSDYNIAYGISICNPKYCTNLNR